MINLHGYGPNILQGTLLTLELCLASLVIAVLLGMVTAMAKLSGSRVMNLMAQVYTTVIRGIPDLVLMLIIFFGGQIFVNQMAAKVGYEGYIDINPFTAGVCTIGFIFGAYMAETFRGAILAVPRGQLEAGQAYGMSRFMIFRRVLLPQMVRHAIPGFGNNWLVLMKTTALVSVIGLNDMVRMAGMAAGATREPFTFYLVVAFNYLVFTSVSIWILNWLNKKYSMGTTRN